MISGVTIGGMHSYQDFGMLLASKSIEFPEPQITQVEIPGRNGLLDLSTAVTGDIAFKNRTITLSFMTTDHLCGRNWADFLTYIANETHGEETKLVFDDDPEYYYTGRCTVSNFKTARKKRTLDLTFDCYPFKMKHEYTVVTVPITTSISFGVDLQNGRMPTELLVESPGFGSLECGDYSVSLFPANGAMSTATGIILAPGANSVIGYSSTQGNMIFKYREGAF